MTGSTAPRAGGNSERHPDSRPANQPANGTPAVPGSGHAAPGTAGTARRHTARAATAPVTGRPHKPCSPPPKPRPAAYDRRPTAGPGRAPRRAQRQSAQTRQVRVELPDEPPQLTPGAARALLRVLLKAHAARNSEQADQTVTDHSARSATGMEGKG
jgi:hypothetical protein